MPSGAVQHENRVRAPGDGPGYLGEVGIHRLRVGMGHDQRSGGTAFGADGTEDVGPFVAGVARRAWAAASVGPDAGQRALLADPSVRRENGPRTVFWPGSLLEPYLQRLGPGVLRQRVGY
jgi:hypothetical protein